LVPVRLAARLPPTVARDWSLVLTAVGIQHQRESGLEGEELWVDAGDQARAAAEIGRYLRENHERAVAPVHFPRYGHAAWGIAAYVAVLVSVTGAALYRLFDRNWVNRGVLEVSLLREAEWWRAVTALTLHADLGHLLANLAFGILFAYPASQFVGVGVAWLAIVLGAAAANVVDMALHPPEHSILGASTAVFTALGLASAFTWRRRATGSLTWMQRLAPLVAGVALLAFTGTGGERTDVLAHLLGFVAGVGIGSLLARTRLPPPGRTAPQWIAGGLALAILAGAWMTALLSG
jgi:rhomboid protease GluP